MNLLQLLSRVNSRTNGGAEIRVNGGILEGSAEFCSAGIEIQSENRHPFPIRQAGFTLIELMIGLFITSIVVSGVGLYVAAVWHSVNDSTLRINETSQAQVISQGLESYLTNSYCVNTTASTLVAGDAATACTTSTPDLVIYGGTNTLKFWAPAAPGSAYAAEFEVLLTADTINGFTTNYLTVKNLGTGSTAYLGNYVSNLNLYYFDPAYPSCTGTGDPNGGAAFTGTGGGTNDVLSIRMVLTMQESPNAPDVYYSSCFYLPNS